MDGKNRDNRTVNIGLANVNNRIKLSYGDEYGIMKNSKAGTRTEVVIMMPLFTDIRMPGMSWLELIKNLKDAFSRALLILVSGYAEFAFAQRAVAYGAFGYCLKPFDDNRIIGDRGVIHTVDRIKDAIQWLKIKLTAILP